LQNSKLIHENKSETLFSNGMVNFLTQGIVDMETAFGSPKMGGFGKEQFGACVSRSEMDESGIGAVMVEQVCSICSRHFVLSMQI